MYQAHLALIDSRFRPGTVIAKEHKRLRQSPASNRDCRAALAMTLAELRAQSSNIILSAASVGAGRTLTNDLPKYALRFRSVCCVRNGIKLRFVVNYRTGSDIDLCLDAPEMGLQELLAIDTEIDDLLMPWKVDLAHQQKLDSPELLAHIQRVGVQVYPG